MSYEIGLADFLIVLRLRGYNDKGRCRKVHDVVIIHRWKDLHQKKYVRGRS